MCSLDGRPTAGSGPVRQHDDSDGLQRCNKASERRIRPVASPLQTHERIAQVRNVAPIRQGHGQNLYRLVKPKGCYVGFEIAPQMAALVLEIRM
jgi:hypothetical protein